LSDQINKNNGEYVLYWMRNAVRGHENPALSVSVRLANQLGVAPIVLYGISNSYPYASDRHHAFKLQGARDLITEFESLEVNLVVYLENSNSKNPNLEYLVQDSVVTVVEEFPVDPNRSWINNLDKKTQPPLLCVDTDCTVPMNDIKPGLDRAYKYRNATKDRRSNAYNYDWERPEPEQTVTADKLGMDSLDVRDYSISDLLRRCDIDHSIGPVDNRQGGSDAGYQRWKTFKTSQLDRYHANRNDPTQPEAVSRLSPYLHHGHISPFRIAREASEHGTDGAEKFIDELITWREMAHYFCFNEPNHDQFECLPEWARETLQNHQSDPRPAIYSWEELAYAETGDRLWNLCQEWLLRHGELHNNIRMTWAKKLLKWTETPRRALQIAIDLNHRFALDGSDPNSYLGILWCFGGFDRPYDTDRDIIGTVRRRTTDWHESRIDMNKLENIVLSKPYDETVSVGIIGAGIAGSNCARHLQNHDIDVRLYDKSRGHGGRAATRYADFDGSVTFDHGAQYFTARNDQLKRFIPSWLRQGVIEEWDITPAVIEDGKVVDHEDESNRYVGTPTMNEVVKHLSRNVEKQFKTKIESVKWDQDKFILETHNTEYSHDYVVCTAPPAQTANLIEPYSANLAKTCRDFTMLPTWSLMLAFEETLDPSYDAAFVNDGIIDWISRNSSKPQRASTESWVVHANHAWSCNNIEESKDTVSEKLLNEFLTVTGTDEFEIIDTSLHRWRYAKPDNPGDQGVLSEDGLVLAGDWLNGSRVEGAFISGHKAAGKVIRSVALLK
jgi:photolyase PhrII